MKATSFASVAAALFLPSICSALPASSLRQRAAEPRKLLPIGIKDYESALGLQRRDSGEFSDLDFQTQSELIYGSPGDNGQLMLANMTLYAPNGLQIISMERFEGLTKAVDCKGDDGSMSLTFVSQEAFQHALKTWSSINEKDDDKFLLIANHAGCGPDDERQPYIISKVTEDEADLTTYLEAKPTPWTDILETYEVNFGSVKPNTQSRLRERDWRGNFEGSPSGTFSVDAIKLNNPTNIYTDNSGVFKLDCVNCFVQGGFAVTGHYKIENFFDIKDLSASASPVGFSAQLGLQATITASASPAALGYDKELFSAAIPDLGWNIPHVLTVGAILSYNVGFNASIQGNAKFDFGLKSSLPDSAKAVVVVAGDGQSSADGFEGGAEPYFTVSEISAGVSIAAFSKPKISFGFDILGIGKAEAALAVKLPEITATLTAKYDPNGVCSNDDKHTTTGVDFALSAAVAVDAEVDAAFGSHADNALPAWEKELWSKSWDLPNPPCFPIAIPGLQPSDTAAPTVSPTSVASSGLAFTATPSLLIPTGKPIVSSGTKLLFPSTFETRPSGGAGSTGLPSSKGYSHHLGSAKSSSTASGSLTGQSALGTGVSSSYTTLSTSKTLRSSSKATRSSTGTASRATTLAPSNVRFRKL